jgi:hypothetical protein
MQNRQGNTLQSLRGIQAFLDDHADTLGAVATSGARKKFDALVAAASEHVVMQSSSLLSARGATQKLYALREDLLLGHMAPIARLAAAELTLTPELSPLKMPRGKSSTEVLYAAAVGMGEAAEHHAAVLIDAGLAPDFVVKLRGAADALLAGVDARTQHRGAQQGGTRGLRESLRRARNSVRVLDAFIRYALKGNDALLASWDAVRRRPAKTGRAQGRLVAVASDSVGEVEGVRVVVDRAA